MTSEMALIKDVVRRNVLVRFARNEDGSLIIFGLFMFVAMLMIGGVAFDLMRHENVRTKLQNTSDAATLASANMNRSDVVTQEDAKSVVRDYFAKAELSPFLTDIKVKQVVNMRRVSAKAEATLRTTFMRYSGVPELSVTTLGTARQDTGDIEIAMVLDVSGSMQDGSKEANLKLAAKQFINDVIPDTTVPVEERPTISLIPYSDMIDIGPDYAPYWKVNNTHSYSWCVRLPSDVYDTVTWDTTANIEQIGHYDWGHLSSSSPITLDSNTVDPQCRTDGANRVLLHETNPTTLKDHIDGLVADNWGWTAISLGLKWGTAMLDPSTDTIVSAMESDDILAERAKGLPKPYIDPKSGAENTKVLVVMTDGTNTLTRDLKAKFKSGDSDVYYAPLYASYFNNGVSAAYAVYSPIRAANGQQAWFWPYANSFSWANPFSSWGISNQRLTNTELFHKQTSMYIGHYIYTQKVPEHSEYITYLPDNYVEAASYEDYTDAETLDTQTEDICAAADAAGMIIYTVAFEAPSEGKTLMADCASDPSFYYEVNGTDLKLAFSAIARNINQLRLTQ